MELSDKEMKRVFSDEVYKVYYGHGRAYKMNGAVQIPSEENVELQTLIDAVRQQTKDTFQNMTGSLGFAIRDPATGNITYSPLMKFYQGTLDAAMMDIHSGAFSYNTVLERTIRKMTVSGLRWIDYDSGWHNRVDVAARRAVMTGFRQIQGKINEQVAAELHTDTYEVTYHVGARPEHQPWQGRVWTMDQLISVCGLGTGPGLHGWNCYHDYLPFPPGSVRTYTDEQLDQMIKEENTPKNYNGKEYTTYEAIQQQRKMETSMRVTRQQIKLLKAGDADESNIISKKAKYQGQMQTYKDFSKKMKLPEQMDRVYQDGLRGKFTPNKTEEKLLAQRAQDDIIKKKLKEIGIRGEINLHPIIPDVKTLGFDDSHINNQRGHNVSEKEAKTYIKRTVFSTTKWEGKYTDYFSEEGAAYVDNDQNFIRTAFKKEQYDERIQKALEVIRGEHT